MKNSADLGGCYPPRPSALVDNTLLDLQNSSYPTQPHSVIAKYNNFISVSIHYLHNPKIHLYYPPKLLPNHCLQFLLGHENVPREVENNAMQIFGG